MTEPVKKEIQEPAKKLGLVEPTKEKMPNLDEWLEAVERVDTMSMGEIASFIYSGYRNEETQNELQEKIRKFTQQEYEIFANKMHAERKTAGEVVLVLHHMLSFALAKIIKKGLMDDPEEMRRILHKVKFADALARVEEFISRVETGTKKKDGE